nr:hypothetical protein [Tanacetum cinerariifolium]
TLSKKLETLKLEKDGVDGKLAGLLTASKGLDNLIKSQRSDKNKEGPSPTVESTSGDDLNRNSFASDNGESSDSILSKPVIKFVKAAERSTTNKVETVKKPSVRYAEMYRRPTKKSTVRGNQQNWNNLKSQQLGVKMGRSSPKNNYTHRSIPPRPAIHRPYRPPMRPRVQRLERELKERTPIYKVNRGRSRPIMAWVPKKFLLYNHPNKASHIVAFRDYSVQQSPYSKAEDPISLEFSTSGIKADYSVQQSPYSKADDPISLEFSTSGIRACKKLETLKLEKDGVDGKLAGLLTGSKGLDNLIKSQRSYKNKEGLGYNDTVTDYSRPSPTVESTSGDDLNRNSSASDNGESTDSILSKPVIKFVKAAERGNQQNWNNLKSQQLGVKMGRSSPKNNYTHRSIPPRPAIHRPPMRPRVQRLERELKARTPIYKVNRVRSRPIMAWVPKKV